MKNFRMLFLSSLFMLLLNSLMPSTALAALGFGDCPGSYTITASAGTGGTISPSGSISVEEGDNRSFTIIPDAGYSVQNVTVDGSPQGPISSYTFYNVSSDHTIYATFIRGSVTLTVSIVGNGNVTADGTVFDGPSATAFTRTYLSGETAHLSVLGDPGWAFGSWSGALTGNDTPTTLVMDTDKSVTATFFPARIDVSSPDGIVVTPLPGGNVEFRLKRLDEDPDVLKKFKNTAIDVRLTNNMAPLKPQGLSIIKSEVTSITCKWTQAPSPAASGYVVQVHYSVPDPAYCFVDGAHDLEKTIAPGSPGLTIAGSEVTYSVPDPIDPTHTYRCARVRATNSNGSSGFTEPAVAARPPA